MKCPNYDPDAYGCMSWLVLGKCPQADKPCSNGWLPFWTEAERAGLKAMGEELRQIKIARAEEDRTRERYKKQNLTPIFDLKSEKVGIWHAIRAYVSAARRVKEGK